MTRAGVRDEGRGAPAAACKRSFAGPRAPAKVAMTGPERHREPRTERRERPHAGLAFGNGVMRSALWGRSPLTRGRREGPPVRQTPQRSIPAHAGQTPPGLRRLFDARVDPRSRGADAIASYSSHTGSGRSPLTRGRLANRDRPLALEGSIPAHAGQTSTGCAAERDPAVDPRSRGADLTSGSVACDDVGRSPLTRGRPHAVPHLALHTGSIPAHAGQT